MSVSAEEQPRDFTCFQTGDSYAPELDIASDVAVVYGTHGDLEQRLKGWRDAGYATSLMTGIAWGGYDAYYMSTGEFKRDEVQTAKSGRLFMHGDSTTVGYNVPTMPYIEFIKNYIAPAVDLGVEAVFLEEPEFWAETGWSAAFKTEWEGFYGEPWQEPDSSVDAQYRASKLKYELYFRALKEGFAFAKTRAASHGRTIECHVPTHSLINYAQWRIVSPESHLIDIPELDGYIAQVWTGTARSPNFYRGRLKERTFETAFLEYGQMFGMVKPTGKKVWFLADPIEDNPNHSWADYKRNYECTLIASLMWPDVHRYEVMPWPSRIFRGTYPKVDLDTTSTKREGIPADYASEILTVINALNEMEQRDVVVDAGTPGIGVAVSDTLMFQRAAPNPSDAHFGHFYGVALPLVKHGIPVEIVQLENTPHPECLKTCRILFLTYEGQKPLKAAYHEALDTWVRGGGRLIYLGDGADPYHGVREWWNDQGATRRTAADDLFARLGITEKARREPEAVGQGFVRVSEKAPDALSREADGPEQVLGLLGQMLETLGEPIKTQHYIKIRRGPFVAISALDESVTDTPVTLRGSFVDLFDPELPVVKERMLSPGQRALLYDIAWARAHGPMARTLAAGARIREESQDADTFVVKLRGPSGTRGCARILMPAEPTVRAANAIEYRWDAESSTVWCSFENTAQDLELKLTRQSRQDPASSSPGNDSVR